MIHLNTVFGKVIFVKGDLILLKKILHFLRQMALYLSKSQKIYKSESYKIHDEKLSLYSSFSCYWYLRGCIVMLTLVDKAFVVMFYYLSQESEAETLRSLRIEKKRKKDSDLICSCRTKFPYTTFWWKGKFAGNASKCCAMIVRYSYLKCVFANENFDISM